MQYIVYCIQNDIWFQEVYFFPTYENVILRKECSMEDLKTNIKKHLINYVGTITHTGSTLENNNIDFFKNYFRNIEYFREHSENYGFYEIENDHLERKVPWGLLKGQGADTVVLIHHTDTVDTDDYGKNKSLAYKPFELTKMYLEGDIDLDENSKADLQSGNWLFGRGVADMKGGASIHLSLLEEYSKDKNFKGNVLLLGLPDEENLSAGMRSAVYLLKELKEKHNLDYKLMLNVEPHERTDNNVATIYDGSVGKLMPLVYVRGKLAHVGQVFRGFNPINLLSEIVRRTELNTDFIERVGNTTTPPPTWLYMKDRKEVYDVSLPLVAAGYMSILTLNKAPKDIFLQLEAICTEAFNQVIKDMNSSYKKFLEISLLETKELEWKTNVKSYDELYNEAVRDSGEEFEKEIEKLMLEIKEQTINNKISTVEGAYKIIEKTLEFVDDLSPVAVIALAPPYYPNVNNIMIPEELNKMNNLIQNLQEFGKEKLDYDMTVQNYYTGISDLSYSMFVADKENIDYVENNMLLWKDIYYIPLDLIKELSMPVLNIGPWGKDFHKYTERVSLEDLFNNTPQLVDKAIKEVLHHN